MIDIVLWTHSTFGCRKVQFQYEKHLSTTGDDPEL